MEKTKQEKIPIPFAIHSLIDNKPYTVDDIGMSGNQVFIFEDMVLKIEEKNESIDRQVQMMQWLEGKVPVPKVIAYEVENGKSYLLMSKVNGVMSCDTYYLEHPQELLEALATGLKMLWEVDVTECPCIRDADAVLMEARLQVQNGWVDLDNVEPTTFGEDGFDGPGQLIEWLENHRPSFEPVLSHGDFCLPNVFLEDDQVKGFIDLGRAGVGDKWNDIALCYRSLKHNFDGTYGGKVYENFNPDMLFEKLGVEPDWEKIKWYLLLDELF
ncbi:MAG: aminoglycoside 3'-phosphotransferase [Agathobacter sp.]|nr:aminoglycoside 3'-phosphotransferase [Agathobacter sp.]